MPQQAPQLTPEQVQELVQDWNAGVLTREQLATRPDILQQVAPFLQGPPPDRPGARSPEGEPINWTNPGTFESALSLPASLAGLVPALKAFTVPAATVLGGIGAGIDTAREGRFSIGDIVAGGARQGAMEAGGNLLGGRGARGIVRSALPDLTDEGAEIALRVRGKLDPRPVGRNVPAARAKVRSLGEKVSGRIGELDTEFGRSVPRGDLYKGASELVQDRGARSMKDEAMEAAVIKEIREGVNAGKATLKPSDVQLKKQGAREGYEALQKAQVRGVPVSTPSVVDELVGDNAQRILEQLDEARTKSLFDKAFGKSLHAQNKELGGALNLRETLEMGRTGARGDLIRRVFAGSLAGASAGALPNILSGDMTVNGEQVLQRYGPLGVAGGAAFGLAPFVSAKTLRLLGEAAPSAERLAEILAELESGK